MTLFHVVVRRTVESEETLLIEAPIDIKIEEIERMNVLDAIDVRVIRLVGVNKPAMKNIHIVAMSVAPDLKSWIPPDYKA
jgi:hypothetical protein